MLKFIAGVGCGVAIGLLIAPASGEETREQLRELAQEPVEAARRKVQDVRQSAGEMGANLGRQAAEKIVDKATPETLSKSGT